MRRLILLLAVMFSLGLAPRVTVGQFQFQAGFSASVVIGAEAVHVVSTIAELKGIIPQAGEVAVVLGRDAAGDGGGGMFRYSDGAEYIDNSVVFCADEDLSAEQSLAVSAPLNAVVHTDLVRGTVYALFSNGLVISDAYMHKHGTQWSLAGTPAADPTINFKTGLVHDNGAISVYAGAISGTASLKYKFATNPRRWVRMTEGETFHTLWVGLPTTNTTDTTLPTDDQPTLCWAVNDAIRLGYRRLSLDNKQWRPKTTIEVAGVTICDGLGGDGFGKDTQSGVKVTDFDPMYNYRDAFSVTSLTALSGVTTAQHLDRVRVSAISLTNNTFAFKNQNNASYVAFEDVEIDCNALSTSRYVTTQSDYDSFPIDNFQNVTRWAGISCGNEDGRTVPANAEFHLKNVLVKNSMAAGIGTSEDFTQFWDNVWAGNSIRNHPIYGLCGYSRGTTLFGYAHGTLAYGYWGRHENIDVRDTADNTVFPGAGPSEVVTVKGRTVFSAATPYPAHRGLTISGGNWDMQFCGVGVSGISDGLTVENVKATGSTTKQNSFYSPNINAGFTLNMPRGQVFRNITLVRRGFPFYFNSNANDFWLGFGTKVENVLHYELNSLTSTSTSPVGSQPMLGFIAAIDEDDADEITYNLLTRPVRFENYLSSDRTIGTLFRVDVRDSDAVFVRTYIDHCDLDCAHSTIFIAPTGTGRWNAMTVDDPTKLRFYFSNTRLPALDKSGEEENYELFFALSQFRNCWDKNGLGTDIHVEYDGTVSNGATYVDVSAPLYWWGVPTAYTVWDQRYGRIVAREHTATGKLSNRFWVHKSGTDIEDVADKRSPTIRCYLDSAMVGDTPMKFSIDASINPF